ncbi:hypothetical protein [Sandaracinus amylolyticus]|uniref:Uncharacterized protein n=1 Tax=Sandaracinus amylolyticus TaxID=927083 RepID=A0A0F6YM73_9BACT|nr:hypothetical protein [Sandaracinus amylolyticus]AKF10372.1 hypothetical protein DB32_007521 [Sandaracinus amylolyticus]
MIEKLERWVAGGLTAPRVIAGASVGCVMIGALACGSEPTAVVVAEPPVIAAAAAPPGVVVAPPVVAAAAPAAPVVVTPPPAPSHGGTVVMAGAYPVEVVPHESGEVYAYVVGEAPPPDAELTVVVPVTGGVRTVELAWEPGERRFGGRVRRARIVPGPVDVVLVVGGARWVGHVATFVVLPAVVVVETAPAGVIVVEEHWHGKHRKHRKHRGWGHGRGHGVRVRF